MRIRLAYFILFSLLSTFGFGQTVNFEFNDVCLGDTTVLISTAISPIDDPILFWGWDLTNNNQFNDATGEEVRYKFSQADTYLIGLRIITESGESAAIYKEVQVGHYPVAEFSFDNACANDFTGFTNESTIENEDLENFIWNFGDGTSSTSETNPDHWYNSPGIYSVQLIAQSNLGCNDTIVKVTEIQPIPILNFEYSGETTFTEGENLIVNALGDFDQILWSTGSTNTSITITTGGYYFAQIKKNGCPNLGSFNIIVHDKVGITNLITPNGDGYNDYWEIFHIENHSPCQVSIFSREGLLIYSSNNYDNNWDGTFNGKPLPEGTYYYVVNCDKGLSQKGALSIIR